jgi:hypothetical protein
MIKHYHSSNFFCQARNVCSESHDYSTFNEAMQTLWPNGVKFDVLLLVTDTAPHMRKAAGFSVIYTKLMGFFYFMWWAETESTWYVSH